MPIGTLFARRSDSSRRSDSRETTEELTLQRRDSQRSFLGISPRRRQTNEYPNEQLLLINALRDGDVDQVNRILDSFEKEVFKSIMQTPVCLNPRSKVSFMTTILHVAARRGDPEPFPRLMEELRKLSTNDKNAVLDAQDRGGKSALHVAIEKGHVNTAKSLIREGANIYIEDSMKQTPLHVAVIWDMEAIALNLLEFIEPNNTSETPGSGPATPETCSKAVRRLLVMQDSTGKTALHHACMMGKSQLVILMLAATAKAEDSFRNEFLNKADKKNRSALFYATQKHHSKIVWLLAQELRESGTRLSTLIDEDDKTVLHWAAEGEHDATVNAILAAVALESKELSFESKDASKDASKSIQPNATPNQPSIAFYVNKRSKEGLTALDLAINKINPNAEINTISSLIDHGADPASKGHDQLTSLQRARFSNNQNVIKKMEKAAGAPTTAATSESTLSKTIVEFIKEHKEAVSALKDQTSPLHQEALASQERSAKIIQKVLEEWTSRTRNMEPHDILLIEEGDPNSGFRTKNAPGDKARNVLIDKGDTRVLRTALTNVTHGDFTFHGDGATLLIFEFNFVSMKSSRKFTSGQITLRFDDASGNFKNRPIVEKIAPAGVFAINKSTSKRDIRQTLNAGIKGEEMGIATGLGYLWEINKSGGKEDATRLAGTKRVSSDFGEDDTVMWTVEEDSVKQLGIPNFLRTAVLLRRRADVPFCFTIDVVTRVNFEGKLWGLLGRSKRNSVGPVRLDRETDLKELGIASLDSEIGDVDLKNMKDIDISEKADIVMATLLEFPG